MNRLKITIIDYGIGNLYSVQRAFEVSGASDISISSDPEKVVAADRVVLPGVGAFADGIHGLRERGLDLAIHQFASTGRPLLGICLGMQLLATTSEEFGAHAGLDLIPGRVNTMPSKDTDGMQLKVPYVGWNALTRPVHTQWEGSMLSAITVDQCVYLVHSFQFQPIDEVDVLATYQYGGHEITAAVKRENITGLQFHPEKSGAVGLSVLSEFLRC